MDELRTPSPRPQSRPSIGEQSPATSRQVRSPTSPALESLDRDSLLARVNKILGEHRRKLMPFPYMVGRQLLALKGLTPFLYYTEMLAEMMEKHMPYDTLPNFTAIDAQRVLGIGRNEFIDLVTRSKPKSLQSFFKLRRASARDSLPRTPCKIPLQPWWIVWLDAARLGDPDSLEEDERLAVDKMRYFEELRGETSVEAGILDPVAVEKLYRRGVIALEVPVAPDDIVHIPPLEEFIMNRTSGDDFEKLLYNVFVTADEHTSVQEVSGILGADVGLVQQAFSFYCRVGIAMRKRAPTVDDPRYHRGWREKSQRGNWETTPEKTRRRTGSGNEGDADEGVDASVLAGMDASSVDLPAGSSGCRSRCAFLFDAGLAATLMMGNLGAGLKSLAVTLFEVGKISMEQMNDFCEGLSSIRVDGESEIEEYARQAMALHRVLKMLLSGSGPLAKSAPGGVDMLRCESIAGLDEETRRRLLCRNYNVVICAAPVVAAECQWQHMSIPPVIGPPVPEWLSGWSRMFLYAALKDGPVSLLLPRGTRLSRLPSLFSKCAKLEIMAVDDVTGANTVSSNVALPVLNNMLVQHAILVQEDGETAQEAFPGSSPVAAAIEDALPVHRLFGVVRTRVCTSTGRRVPLELHFGIPLGSATDDVLNRVHEDGLLEPDSIDSSSESMRRLALDFLLFIEKHVERPYRPSRSSISLPTAAVVFTGGSVRPWSPFEE